jgi:hypothetical protein
MAEKPTKPSAMKVWAERLRGRSRMAVATIGGVFMVGFFCASKPLIDRIDAANVRLTRAETRMTLAGDVSDLRKQSSLYQKKLMHGIDLNDWTQYFLSGINAHRVRLIRMDPKDQLSLGPCKVLTWNIELEGDFESLSQVVEWMESGTRLMRIDRIVFEGKHGRLTLAVSARGLALDVPPEKIRAEKEKADIEKAKAVKAAAVRAEQRKNETSDKWIDEKPMTLPPNVQLPGGVKLPNSPELQAAVSEAQK